VDGAVGHFVRDARDVVICQTADCAGAQAEGAKSLGTRSLKMAHFLRHIDASLNTVTIRRGTRDK
jgi:carbonic anhydrase